MTSPTIIVLMPTYNHENYIGQAIESVLAQITTFDVHLYISDDASTDSTFLISSSFQNKNRVSITLNRNERNLGALKNGALLRTVSQESGSKYVSILEGDDYWTDPYKLQKQVDFLERNELFSLVYHPVMVLMSNNDLVADNIGERFFKAPTSSIYDVAMFGNYIHTPSVVFRNFVDILPKNFVEAPVGDIFLYNLIAKTGDFARLDFYGAIYRNSGGSYSSLSFENRKQAFQKTLYLISESVDDSLASFILRLRIHHNSLIGKVKSPIYKSSGVTGWLSFLLYVNKFELLKAIIKLLVYRKTF